MAVLVGVLAPAYLTYVEKSRLQKDVSAVGEIVSAIEVAMTDEKVNTDTASAKYVITGGTEFDFSGALTTGSADTNETLKAELAKTIGKVNLTSNGLNAKTVTIEVTRDASAGVKIKVTSTATEEDVVNALKKLGEYEAPTATPAA